MRTYVNGFMVDLESRAGVLIQKARPAFQSGKWNGVGGKVEHGENPWEAMVREFREETGIETQVTDWEYMFVLHGDIYRVHFFRHVVQVWPRPEVQQMTDEHVQWCQLDVILSAEETLASTKWVIPMMLDPQVKGPFTVYHE